MKTTSTIRSNAQFLMTALLDKGLTVSAAARETKISNDLFGKLLRKNKPISYRTAGKLKAQFGDSAIRISEPE